MKRIISLFLVALLSFSTTCLSFADTATEHVRYFSCLNGIMTEISTEEYNRIVEDGLVLTNSMEKAPTISEKEKIRANGMTDNYSTYIETSSSVALITAEGKRISSVIYNGTSSPAARTFESATTSTCSFSTSLSSEEENLVKRGVSFSWEYSASLKDSTTYHIAPRMYGWVEFAPYKNKSTGVIKNYNWLGTLLSTKNVTAYSPKKTNGNLDGLYTFKERSTPPNY